MKRIYQVKLTIEWLTTNKLRYNDMRCTCILTDGFRYSDDGGVTWIHQLPDTKAYYKKKVIYEKREWAAHLATIRYAVRQLIWRSLLLWALYYQLVKH